MALKTPSTPHYVVAHEGKLPRQEGIVGSRDGTLCPVVCASCTSSVCVCACVCVWGVVGCIVTHHTTDWHSHGGRQYRVYFL